MAEQPKSPHSGPIEVSSKFFTLPNIISFARLCLVPLFFCLLLSAEHLKATLVFALAASTDWIDGQIARKTNQVSKIGQLLDPLVDRVLMISGVLGLYLIGSLPLWIIAVVLLRDLFLLAGCGYLLRRYQLRIPVLYVGKVATTFLYIGFSGLLLGWPLLNGFGLVEASWLPGFSSDVYSWGIWFVYVGLILSLTTMVCYIASAVSQIYGDASILTAKD